MDEPSSTVTFSASEVYEGQTKSSRLDATPEKRDHAGREERGFPAYCTDSDGQVSAAQHHSDSWTDVEAESECASPRFNAYKPFILEPLPVSTSGFDISDCTRFGARDVGIAISPEPVLECDESVLEWRQGAGDSKDGSTESIEEDGEKKVGEKLEEGGLTTDGLPHSDIVASSRLRRAQHAYSAAASPQPGTPHGFPKLAGRRTSSEFKSQAAKLAPTLLAWTRLLLATILLLTAASSILISIHSHNALKLETQQHISEIQTLAHIIETLHLQQADRFTAFAQEQERRWAEMEERWRWRTCEITQEQNLERRWDDELGATVPALSPSDLRFKVAAEIAARASTSKELSADSSQSVSVTERIMAAVLGFWRWVLLPRR